MFIHDFAKKYVGKAFEIDCFDIEVHGFEDNKPPIFKGPGIIHGDSWGRLSFKLYNQIPFTKDTFDLLRKVETGDDPKTTNVRFFAKDYNGIAWNGGWSIPRANLWQLSNIQNSLIHGEFDQLATRVEKVKGDKYKDITELVYAGPLNLPYSGTIHEKQYHGTDVISTTIWKDHHDLNYKNSVITFQESSDHGLTNVAASHHDRFTPPYVENWVTEALTFLTASIIYPRMVIRHFENDALVFIRETPKVIKSAMPPPFFSAPHLFKCTWDVFLYYISKCEESQQFDFMQVTRGLHELILASSGTVQGFLISLSVYIENCINQIFRKNVRKSNGQEDTIKGINSCLDSLKGDTDVIGRAKRILSMLNTPDPSKDIDTLIMCGVIRDVHKEVWKNARPYLAHGNIIDFSKEEEFWHYRNHLISMAYRLTLRIIGYKGKVIDYDGTRFQFLDFLWNENCDKRPGEEKEE